MVNLQLYLRLPKLNVIVLKHNRENKEERLRKKAENCYQTSVLKKAFFV